MNLKQLVRKSSRALNRGISEASVERIYKYCLNAGYEEVVAQCEVGDIRDIVFANIRNFSHTNPLATATVASEEKEILCPSDGDMTRVVVLSNGREVRYCEKHRLVIPLNVA